MKKVLLLVLVPLLCVQAQAAGIKSQEPEIQSQWNDAKVAIFGDSITDKGQLELNDTYWHQLIGILGIEPYCYGISGHETKHIIGQAERLMEEHGRDVDAILIFIGTNDYNASVPIGDWYREEITVANRNGVDVPLKHRVMLFGEATVKSRINEFMSYLKHNYPTKQIILLTPIHRGYFNCWETNIQPDESFANAIGLYPDDYVNAIKEAANVWAVPVIDLNAVCGLYPLEPEHTRYFREAGKKCRYTVEEASKARAGTEQGLEYHDLLHPDTEGHLRMAYALAYQLLGYPSHF